MNAVTAAEAPSVADFARTFRHVQAEIHKVIVGHEQAVEELLSALFAGGHVLIEGVPGTGLLVLAWRPVSDPVQSPFERADNAIGGHRREPALPRVEEGLKHPVLMLYSSTHADHVRCAKGKLA